MDINIFKDLLFDTINESALPIEDIDTYDEGNSFIITTSDNKKFIINIKGKTNLLFNTVLYYQYIFRNKMLFFV